MNGHFVVSHVGGYLPFSCDISEYVHSGENELVIMVQDLSDTSYHAKGKQKLNVEGCIILLKVEYGDCVDGICSARPDKKCRN